MRLLRFARNDEFDGIPYKILLKIPFKIPK